jgi:metal-sulfur cluster biosynthetic enzyme
MNERAVLPSLTDSRLADVWSQLSHVTDPELDDSVTDMGFVTDVEIRHGDEVHVSFQLPTYWCSPNFAFMMGQDMRTAVLELAWVKSASVVLGEHMYVEKINRGVNEGLPFADAFGDEATGNLDDLRRTFLHKAFQWRQEALLKHLLDTGETVDDVVAWTVYGLSGRLADLNEQRLIDRYLDRRHVAGAFDGAALAFVTLGGDSLQASELATYLKLIRRVRINAEFNGALCRRLLVERFNPDAAPAASNPSSDLNF